MAIVMDQRLQANLVRYAELCAAEGWPVHIELLPDVLERIVEFYQPVRLYIFGSLVRGDFNAHSDMDLFIVVPDDAGKERRSGQQAYHLKTPTRIPADIQFATVSGFEARRHSLTLLDATVDEEGRLLYAA